MSSSTSSSSSAAADATESATDSNSSSGAILNVPLQIPSSVYVTLLTDDSFLAGVQTLIHSTDKHAQTARDFVVLVTPNIAKTTRKVLARKTGSARKRKLRVVVREVDPIANPHAKDCHVEGWVNSGFTKLHIWELEEVS